MEGLNLTEIKYSSIFYGVETLRFDSEFYAKEYVEIEEFIKRNADRFIKFSSIGLSVDCSAFYAGIESFYGKGDMPLIRVQNVKNSIDYEGCVGLPLLCNSEYSTLKQVKEGDIVITKGGTIGKVGYVTKRAYASRDLIFIDSSSLPEYQSVFLFLYLSTDFAFKQLIRTSSQCAQPHLTITLVKNFDIFAAEDELQHKCYSLYKKSQEYLKESNELYRCAEKILIEKLNIGCHSSCSNAVNVKTLRESFFSTGRLDAEYYMPKYEDLYNSIKKFPTASLGRLTKIMKSIEPGREAYKKCGVPFIRVANLSKFGLTSPDIYLDKVVYANAIRPSVDTILLSKDGTVGIAYKVDETMDIITSGAILHLYIKCPDVLPYYLTLVLNSPVAQLQAERDTGGSIIQHWRTEEIEELQIPLLPMNTQQEISKTVQESFRLRKESFLLLQRAKGLVESEIEKLQLPS